MELQRILKTIIAQRGMTKTEVAERMGTKLGNVSDRLNKKQGMTVRTLLRFLEVLGCDLIIRGDGEWIVK